MGLHLLAFFSFFPAMLSTGVLIATLQRRFKAGSAGNRMLPLSLHPGTTQESGILAMILLSCVVSFVLLYFCVYLMGWPG